MKKRTLSTLLLAGVMAATMIPTAVFAAATPAQKTTVGYTAGGNMSPDGRVMVTVPMDVDFTNEKDTVDAFDVKVKVWDANTNGYADPSATNLIGRTIGVSVTSANGYILHDAKQDAAKAGKYEYSLDKTATGDVGPLVLDGSTNEKGAANQAVLIGTLKDASGDGTGTNAARYTIEGDLTLTKKPTPGKTDKGEFFSDVLTYTFAGLTD